MREMTIDRDRMFIKLCAEFQESFHFLEGLGPVAIEDNKVILIENLNKLLAYLHAPGFNKSKKSLLLSWFSRQLSHSLSTEQSVLSKSLKYIQNDYDTNHQNFSERYRFEYHAMKNHIDTLQSDLVSRRSGIKIQVSEISNTSRLILKEYKLAVKNDDKLKKLKNSFDSRLRAIFRDLMASFDLETLFVATHEDLRCISQDCLCARSSDKPRTLASLIAHFLGILNEASKAEGNFFFNLLELVDGSRRLYDSLLNANSEEDSAIESACNAYLTIKRSNLLRKSIAGLKEFFDLDSDEESFKHNLLTDLKIIIKSIISALKSPWMIATSREYRLNLVNKIKAVFSKQPYIDFFYKFRELIKHPIDLGLRPLMAHAYKRPISTALSIFLIVTVPLTMHFAVPIIVSAAFAGGASASISVISASIIAGRAATQVVTVGSTFGALVSKIELPQYNDDSFSASPGEHEFDAGISGPEVVDDNSKIVGLDEVYTINFAYLQINIDEREAKRREIQIAISEYDVDLVDYVYSIAIKYHNENILRNSLIENGIEEDDKASIASNFINCTRLHTCLKEVAHPVLFRMVAHKLNQPVIIWELLANNITISNIFYPTFLCSWDMFKNAKQVAWLEGSGYRALTVAESNFSSNYIEQRIKPYFSKGFEFYSIAGNGSCLFNAIAFNTSYDGAYLRSCVADLLHANFDQYYQFIDFTDDDLVRSLPVIPNETQRQYAQRYVEALRDPAIGLWGGNIEIKVLMRILKRPIVVLGHNLAILNRSDLRGFEHINERPIFVSFGNSHYDALRCLPGRDAKQHLSELLVLHDGRDAVDTFYLESGDRLIIPRSVHTASAGRGNLYYPNTTSASSSAATTDSILDDILSDVDDIVNVGTRSALSQQSQANQHGRNAENIRFSAISIFRRSISKPNEENEGLLATATNSNK